jgi:PAS domain S-box-containing protein
MTILIIEDDAGISELLKDKFEECGYKTACAQSAGEALAWLEVHSPYLMVLDYGLPDMNAKELIGELKQRERPLPDFIVSTGQGDERIAVDMMKLGARDYIVKDAHFLEMLSEVVRRVSKEIENENKLKRAEEALRESEVKYRQVVENATEGIFVIQDESYCYVNPRGAEIFNTTRERILSGKLYEFVHPEDRMACANQVSLRKKGKTASDLLVHRIIDTIGNEKWVEVRGVSILWEGKHASMCFVIDITKRKQVEDSLRESEEKFSRTFHNAPLLITISNLEDGTYIDVNEEFLKVTGFAREEVIEKTSVELGWIRAEDRARLAEIIGTDGRISGMELSLTAKGGKETTCLWSGIIITIRGKACLLSLAQDISEHKRSEKENARLEDQYRQAQKVEAIGRLAGGVAHDLNNLLTPILGYGEMLMDDFGSDDPRRSKVELIVKAGDRAKDLVRQLLSFARKQTLEYKSVDINKIIGGFEKLLRRIIREDITLEIIPSPEIRTIRADIGQIEQVIMNLAINAQDAMPQGGCLTMETALTELDEKYAASRPGVLPGLYVMLAVSDTGCGMDKETIGKIFEPFFSTKGDQGTGMGLATVYGIVKQHGGNIWVYSEPGKGATFKIYLPVSEDAHIETKTREKPALKGKETLRGSETILLAEDSKQARILVLTMLEQHGYTIIEAENGIKALAALDSHDGPVHLLLTDVVMPGMNGKDLFAKASEKRSDLKVLYMSGYTENVIVHRGVLDEGVHFIQKPFTVKSLVAKVREVLDND